MSRIAIVGCGVGGLAAALFLHRQGHDVACLEAFATPTPVGSGLLIQPVGQAVLRRLGLLDEVAGRAARIDRLRGRSSTGSKVFDVCYRRLGPDAHGLGVQRASLHGALWDACIQAGVPVHVGRDVTGMTETADGAMLSTRTGGSDGGPFDLVIDASGAHSALAHLCGAGPARPFAYGAVWATVRDDGLWPGVLEQRYRAAHTMIGLLPTGTRPGDPAPRAAFFWSLKPDAHADWQAGFEAWRDQGARRWPELAGVFAQFSGPLDFALARYGHRTVARPWHGRLVMMGDAAHQTSPQLGQGANAALLDAAILSDIIAAQGAQEAGPAYARARRAAVRFHQVASWWLTPFFQSDLLPAALLRDAVFPLINLVPPLHTMMAQVLGGAKEGVFAVRSAEQAARWGATSALPGPG